MADRMLTSGSNMADRMRHQRSNMADRMLTSDESKMAEESKMAALPVHKFTEKYIQNKIIVQSAPT